MLDDTLVIWGGEFGRGVAGQGKWDSPEASRDHHPRYFTVWLAGGGVKPGITQGSTDDFSYNVTDNPVNVHDLHATVLHLLGIDHERLTYRFQGLDFRLTGVEPARMVVEIVALGVKRKRSIKPQARAWSASSLRTRERERAFNRHGLISDDRQTS